MNINKKVTQLHAELLWFFLYFHNININNINSVTNSYLGSIPVTNELHQVIKESKSHLISGGDSSCSWVLVCALGPKVREEL